MRTILVEHLSLVLWIFMGFVNKEVVHEKGKNESWGLNYGVQHTQDMLNQVFGLI